MIYRARKVDANVMRKNGCLIALENGQQTINLLFPLASKKMMVCMKPCLNGGMRIPYKCTYNGVAWTLKYNSMNLRNTFYKNYCSIAANIK